ncbi:hypothetical protein ES703_39259 [subsurface metagenome]
MGLVEHFDPPIQIFQKHLELLKPNGYLVIGVPNLFSLLYKSLQYLVNKQWLDIHKKFLPEHLFKFIGGRKLKTLFCGYVGVFNLYLLGISKSKKSTHKFIKLSQIAADKLHSK